MTEKQRHVLGLLADTVERHGFEYVQAYHVGRIEWERTAPLQRAALPSATSIGNVLGRLHRLGLVERQWNQYGGVWEYRPTRAGYQAVKS